MCDFVAGEVLFTTGLDMQCRPVVVRCRFVRLHESGRCVTESGGVRVVGGRPGDYFKSRSQAVKALPSR